MRATEKIYIYEWDTYGDLSLDPGLWGLREQGFDLTVLTERRDVGPADVAIVTGVSVAGAGVLSAVITAVFAYLSRRKSGTIEIHGSSGRKIEVPEGTSKEDIQFYIDKAKEIDASSILISDVAPREQPPDTSSGD